jgi:signal transduction histidine kinase
LGLAIVASIISSNQGTYGVQSIRGLGSTFWFELPLAADTANT